MRLDVQRLDAAADTLVKALLEVVPFDYLQLVAFESDTKTVEWHLLYSNGKKNDVPEADLVLEDTPIAWVHESQQALVTDRLEGGGAFCEAWGIPD